MSNAPDRYEKFVVPEGVKKIAFERDTKVADAGTFTIQREDHTVGNAVRLQLLRDDHVIFSGYRIPHPLEHRMVVRVQTDGQKTPLVAMQESLAHINLQVQSLHGQFQQEVQRVRPTDVQ